MLPLMLQIAYHFRALNDGVLQDNADVIHDRLQVLLLPPNMKLSALLNPHMGGTISNP